MNEYGAPCSVISQCSALGDVMCWLNMGCVALRCPMKVAYLYETCERSFYDRAVLHHKTFLYNIGA